MPAQGELYRAVYLREAIPGRHRQTDQDNQANDQILLPVAEPAEALGLHDADLLRLRPSRANAELVQAFRQDR